MDQHGAAIMRTHYIDLIANPGKRRGRLKRQCAATISPYYIVLILTPENVAID